jgi:hypothetical protein
LYLVEPPVAGPGGQKGALVDDYTLASRLAYFLWDTMPDDRLFALADRKTLSRPSVLQAEVRRMLSDRRAQAFAKSFVFQWLQLRRLHESAPDFKKYPLYHDNDLQQAMENETELFFANVFDKNLPITSFLQSDFTFANEALAKHYGIDGVRGSQFRKVALPRDGQRGGVLGQGSILVLTTVGTETSPVKRGVWVMENVLGVLPPQPPPNIEPLDPDSSGATTIREQLDKHRKLELCRDCHRRIDPLGFALENYDQIGRWRVNYEERLEQAHKAKKPIDEARFRVEPGSELPDGKKFANVTELKNILLARKQEFAKCLTSKMLSYAVGRELAPHDRRIVTQLSDQLRRKGYGLRDLVTLVATSPALREM